MNRLSIDGAFFSPVAFARDRAEYFATKLYSSLSGLGTDDEQLQRLVISHCEVRFRQTIFYAMISSNSSFLTLKIVKHCRNLKPLN